MVNEMEIVDPDAPPTFVNATCHVGPCMNNGYTLEVAVRGDTPLVICGACMQRITDIVPID